MLELIHTPAWLVAILAEGLGGGIQTVSTFIPPIFFIFLCLSFLEDSGYMSRAAFVMDHFLRTMLDASAEMAAIRDELQHALPREMQYLAGIDVPHRISKTR